METIAIRTLLAVLGLIVSARTAVRVPALGPVPVLWLAAAAVVLAMALGVLCVARLLVRDGLRLRPVPS